MTYEYQTKPFEHQRKLFESTWNSPVKGLLWEQGCGKSKPMIDTACALYESGEIDGVVIVAPNNVHRNWIKDEIPVHMPKRVLEKTKAVYFDTSKAATRKTQQNLHALLHHEGLAVLAISYDGLVTKKTKLSMPDKGRDFAGKFMRRRRCLMIVDESHYAKSPTTERTKVVLAASPFAPYRRILTGTPATSGPFNVYSQMKILDPTIWERHGISTFSGFKQQFGVWVNKPFGPGGRLIAVCDSYKNLDQLNKIILTVCDRLTKDDVLDLPPKLFTKRYVDLNAEQQRIYDGLKYDMQADLGDGNGVTEAVLPIVRLLRYQQVICGYVPNQDGELQRIAGPNYRLGAIEDIDAETSSPGLIWARFTEDINQIMHILGDSAVRYDGTISDDEKEVSKRAFKAGDKKWFVGNAAAGRTGLTLNEGKTVVYYSNYFNLEYRLQSEDRNHRIGQNDSVNYIDLVAQDTVDEHIIKCMRNNFDIASKITGDTLKEWI